MKSWKTILARTGNVLFFSVIILLVLITVVALVSRIGANGRLAVGKYSFGVIATGSMEPQLPVGTFVVIEKTDVASLKLGDVITFYSDDPSFPNGAPVSHKIVKIHIDGNGSRTFTTRGIANPSNDIYPVGADDVIGKITWNSDFLGSVIRFVQKPYLYPALIVVLLITMGFNAVSVAKEAKKLQKDGAESDKDI